MKLFKLKSFHLINGLLSYTTVFEQIESVCNDGNPTIVELFKKKPTVTLGETHGLLQLNQFLPQLVQTDDLYKNVYHIYIETGNALNQETFDRYNFGETVALEDLQKYWMNTTQSPFDVWSVDVNYILVKSNRELNIRIGQKDRKRVLTTDSLINWEQTQTSEDYINARGSRNEYFDQHSLLIYGEEQIGNHTSETVNQLVEKIYKNT
jgi:hypothetical protein